MSQRKITRGEEIVLAMDVINHAMGGFDDDAITSQYSTEELRLQAEAAAIVKSAMADAKRQERKAFLAYALMTIAVVVLMGALVYEGFFGGPSGTALR